MFGCSFNENYADTVLGTFHNEYGKYDNDHIITKDDKNLSLDKKRFIYKVIYLKNLNIDRYDVHTLKDIHSLASKDVRYIIESDHPNQPDRSDEHWKLLYGEYAKDN